MQFPVILTADEKGIQAGKEVSAVKVTAEVVSQGKEKKIMSYENVSRKHELPVRALNSKHFGIAVSDGKQVCVYPVAE